MPGEFQRPNRTHFRFQSLGFEEKLTAVVLSEQVIVGNGLVYESSPCCGVVV